MENTDLHTHSYYSDGQISPKNLIRLAKKRGIKNLALTDHNSVKGVNEAVKEGKKIRVNVIPSIEVRCKPFEMLGYFIDIKNKDLLKEIKKTNKSVQDMVKDTCKQMRKLGYKVTYKNLEKKFPRAKNNYNELHPRFFCVLKGYGKSTIELSKKLKGKIKKKKIRATNPIKAIKLIKKAGGIPVLAHPWLDKKYFTETNVKKFVKVGLKGIELDNGDRNTWGRDKKIDSKIKRLAKKYNLILTKGTDYHAVPSQEKNWHKLGKTKCDEKVVEELKKLVK